MIRTHPRNALKSATGKSRNKNAGPDRLFRLAAEAYGGFAVLISGKGTIRFANSTLLKDLRHKPENILGHPISVLLRRQDGKPLNASVFRPGHNAGGRSRNFSLFDGSGNRVPCRGKMYQVSAAGTRDHLLILCIPADHDGARADDLLAGNHGLKSLSESIPDGLCVLDAKGKILAANSVLSLMLGRDRNAVVGSTLPYAWHPGEEGSGLLEVVREAGKKGPVLNRHFRGKGPGDVPIILSYSVSALREYPPYGRTRFVATIRNVTGEYTVHQSGMYARRIERLKKQVRRNATRLQTLQEINASVLGDTSFPDIFRRITAGIGKLVDHDLAGIYIFDRDENVFRPHTLSKQTSFSRKLAKFPLTIGEGIVGTAALYGKTVLVNDAQHDPRSKYPSGMKPAIEHIIASPLRGRTSLYGILVVARNRQPRFHEEDALVVQSFADAANVALENTRLYAELELREGRTKEAKKNGCPRSAPDDENPESGHTEEDSRPHVAIIGQASVTLSRRFRTRNRKSGSNGIIP